MTEDAGRDSGRGVDDRRCTSSPPPGRLAYVDNVRAAMVAWIIGGHALLGYLAIGGWPYDEVREVTMAPRVEWVLTAILGPSALFLIGAFFFVSGLVSQAAMARRGPGRFAVERLLQLGVPVAAFILVIWPLFMWFAYLAAGYDVSYWWEFRHRQPFLDSGPMWFAEVLLYVSLGYAAWGWAAARPGRRPSGPRAPLHGRHLVAVAGAITLASFVVRLWFPARSTQILDLHLWQWPQCIGMFALGVAAGRRGWLAEVPGRLYRACGRAVMTIVASLPVAAVAAGVTDVAADATPYLGGWHWQAIVLAGVEGALAVAGSVWLCGLAQRRLTGTALTAWTRSSYIAFALQAPVLLTLAITLRPVTWPAEAKAATVAALGILASFWLAGRLRRTTLRRIL
ncbi:MAG: acyltransferase [Actinomycetota bacterium]|nr:acyltransferase [Actinomycetota bacterium]